LAFFLTPILTPLCSAQEKSEGPTDAKARKTYEKALKYLHEHNTQSAFEPPAAAGDTAWGWMVLLDLWLVEAVL
jgi:hypothetical protein